MLVSLLKKMIDEDSEIVTILKGEDATAEEVECTCYLYRRTVSGC